MSTSASLICGGGSGNSGGVPGGEQGNVLGTGGCSPLGTGPSLLLRYTPRLGFIAICLLNWVPRSPEAVKIYC